MKKFGDVAAVDQVSLTVAPGGIYGVAGLNGAGKSTLLSILAGVMRPDGGRVLYRGADIRRGGSRNVRISYVPQEIALFPDLSVYDNLKFWSLAGTDASKRYERPVKERILEAAGATGLSERLRKQVNVLSGGMKRRVNIAAALVTEPEVLIMDEPTAGLDVKNRRDILNFISMLARRAEGALAVVCTSHQSGELETISDRLLLLDRGRAVFDGAPSEVFSGKYDSYENIDDILYSLGSGI